MLHFVQCTLLNQTDNEFQSNLEKTIQCSMRINYFEIIQQIHKSNIPFK